MLLKKFRSLFLKSNKKKKNSEASGNEPINTTINTGTYTDKIINPVITFTLNKTILQG